MRRSKTMAKIRAGKPVQMCCLGHFIPSFVCQAAHFGFDCIWLDQEHREMEQRELQYLFALSHLYDIDIMLRPSTLEKSRLYRYLEDGATGLMIPHVSTPEKAQMLADAVKFPPIGDRGLDGAGLDSDFILAGGENYPQEANRETFLVVQIETPQAVANVDAIAATPGVDGMFIGPGDLGLRLKLTGAPMEKAFDAVSAAAKKHGKAWGCPVRSKEELRQRHQQGGQLVSNGGDFFAIMNGLRDAAADFQY